MPEAFPGAIITFPMLGESFSLNPSGTYTLFGHTFYWYGAIIGLGFILAALYCMRRAPKDFGISKDTMTDVVLIGLPTRSSARGCITFSATGRTMSATPYGRRSGTGARSGRAARPSPADCCSQRSACGCTREKRRSPSARSWTASCSDCSSGRSSGAGPTL